MHAIAHRDVDAKVPAGNSPDRAGTWYLISLDSLSWSKNPVWVHEGDGNLDLGY